MADSPPGTSVTIPQNPGYFGTDQNIQSWLDQNLAGYLEQNPGAIQWKTLLGSSSVFLPTGIILDFGGATAPDGFVLADGSTYDGTNPLYLNLWAIYGVTYGGSGQSAFMVPDYRGRFSVMKGTNADVSALGDKDAVSLASRTPNASVSISGTTGSGGGGAVGGAPGSTTVVVGANVGSGSQTPLATVTAGTLTGPSHSHSFSGSGTASPGFITINKIIKL